MRATCVEQRKRDVGLRMCPWAPKCQSSDAHAILIRCPGSKSALLRKRKNDTVLDEASRTAKIVVIVTEESWTFLSDTVISLLDITSQLCWQRKRRSSESNAKQLFISLIMRFQCRELTDVPTSELIMLSLVFYWLRNDSLRQGFFRSFPKLDGIDKRLE